MFSDSDIAKLNQLHQDIINRTENSIPDLILYWEILPREIWTYYNHTTQGFDNKTWTNVLIILKHWKKHKDLDNDCISHTL